MGLILVKTFLAIIETGSLVKASHKLNITQSTVTARLRSLEDDVGQTLIHRQKSGIVLTAAGLKFQRYAQAINNMWQQALLETSLPKGMETICNMGFDPDLWTSLGRALVQAIKQRHSTTAMTVQAGTAQQLDTWLSVGTIDAALSYRQATISTVKSHPLTAEELALYATKSETPIKGDPNYIYFDAGPDFGRQHATAYADAGVANHSFASAVMAMDFLMDVGGSCYLPKQLARPMEQKGLLHCLNQAPTFSRQIYLLTNETAGADWPWLEELTIFVQSKQ